MILERPILFVGGKGGVGKTTTASALAFHFAEAGKRTLLVSTDPAHSLGDLFDLRIGDRERELAPDLWALEIDPDAQVERHLAGVARSMREFVHPSMYHEIERQMELTRLSPGAVEAAMLERMCEVMAEASDRFERVVFDTAPTGHTLRLLSLPEIMAAWTDGLLKHRDRSEASGRALKKAGGPRPGEDLMFLDQDDHAGEDERSRRIRDVLLDRRRKFTRARRLLLDPEACAFLLVLIPEKLPILESRKALESLRAHDVPVAGVVVNRVLPSEFLGDFLEQRREQEARYLEEIDRVFASVPRIRVPLLPRDVQGFDGLRQVAGHLLRT